MYPTTIVTDVPAGSKLVPARVSKTVLFYSRSRCYGRDSRSGNCATVIALVLTSDVLPSFVVTIMFHLPGGALGPIPIVPFILVAVTELIVILFPLSNDPDVKFTHVIPLPVSKFCPFTVK